MTKITAVMVKPKPASIIRLKGSSNKNQAINAVVGGVRYKRLVTLVAAPFRININNKLIAPIEVGRIPQSKAPMTGAFQTISRVSKRRATTKQSTVEIEN